MQDYRCLIVSFIGNADIQHVGEPGDNCSPIQRLLSSLDQLLLDKPPGKTPSIRLLLFDDDRDGRSARKEFCEKLETYCPQLGFPKDQLKIHREKIVLPESPTDLNDLFKEVFEALRKDEREYGPADKAVFHLSSGTPPMYLTLLLAAYCLPLKERPVLVETSREQDVVRVVPPYVLAYRKLGERTGKTVDESLSKAVRRALLPNTVVDDLEVEHAYARLYEDVTNERKEKKPARRCVKGPTGAGKWHACQQFAQWRKGPCVEWRSFPEQTELPAGVTLLIRHLDSWPEEKLKRLTELARERPDIAIVATWRTDTDRRPPTKALSGFKEIVLPSLDMRSDLKALARAVVRQLEIATGKLPEQLSYALMTNHYPSGLHDVRKLLIAAKIHSPPGPHPERDVFELENDKLYARDQLHECLRVFADMEFGPESSPIPIEDLLQQLRGAIVLRAQTEGHTQKEIGELLEMSQSKVSEILGPVKERREQARRVALEP